MAVKIEKLFLLSLLLSAPAIARVDYSPEVYLKNYALSACLAMGYSSQEVKNDASAAARGYLEFGDYSLSAHTAVRELAKEYLKKDYPNKSAVSMIAAKCIDLYHSKELSDIILKYKGVQDN